MFVLYVFWGRRCFIDPICRNFCMVLSMFYSLVLVNFLFSLRDINLTLGLLPPRRQVVWRDSVGVWSSRSGSARIFFTRVFSGCYVILTSPKEGQTAVYGYNPALFLVLSVLCWCSWWKFTVRSRRVPEAFELPASDWPEKIFSGQSAKRSCRVTLAFSYTT